MLPPVATILYSPVLRGSFLTSLFIVYCVLCCLLPCSFFNPENVCAIFENSRTVGDKNQSLSRVACGEAAQQLLFGLVVECRGYLVEDKYASRTEQRACNCYALCLTLAESTSLFAQVRVDALRQAVYILGAGCVNLSSAVQRSVVLPLHSDSRFLPPFRL